MIHTVKGFSEINEEVDFFLNSLAFSMIQQMLVIWSLVLLSFLNPACTSGSSWFTYYWSLAWRILIITLLACEILWVSSINLCKKGSCELQFKKMCFKRFSADFIFKIWFIWALTSFFIHSFSKVFQLLFQILAIQKWTQNSTAMTLM